jgi:tetratricopeptide (TPR) repeat protein
VHARGAGSDTGSDPHADAGAPYAAAFRRYLSALDGRDYAGALRALDEAIAAEPTLVEAWHRRALLWRLLGDYVRSSRDHARCVALDPHYRDREAIACGAAALHEAYRHDVVIDGCIDPAAYRDHSDLRRILLERAGLAAHRQALLERPSCNLPCPSLCCHFEDETLAYGVHLGAGELSAVRSFLTPSDPDGEHHLARVEKAHCREAIRSRADWFVPGEAGREYVYYPRRTDATLGDTARRPRTLAYADLAWLTARSRACVFVKDTGCEIHDIGDPPGLHSCRHFLCLTAFVLLIACDLGITTRLALAGSVMDDLHEAALAALRPLADGFDSPEATEATTGMKNALAAALASDALGNDAGTSGSLARYEAARQAMQMIQAGARERAAAAVRAAIRREKP